MIIIKNAKPTKEGKKQFRVHNTGKNGELLKPSENLPSKPQEIKVQYIIAKKH